MSWFSTTSFYIITIDNMIVTLLNQYFTRMYFLCAMFKFIFDGHYENKLFYFKLDSCNEDDNMEECINQVKVWKGRFATDLFP